MRRGEVYANWRKIHPWPVDELSRVLDSARTMAGDVAGIPSRLWWPALLLPILDTSEGHATLLRCQRDVYDRTVGTLRAGGLVYRLHPLAIETLDAIRRHPHPALLPCPMDNSTLLRYYRELLYRAGLPHVSSNLTRRLQVTAERVPDVLDHVDLQVPFTRRERNPTYVRPREHRRWARQKPGTRPKCSPPEVLPEDSLLALFENRSRPLRLAGVAPSTVGGYRTTINRLREHLGAEPLLRHLTDDRAQGFMEWKIEEGRSPATVNGYRRDLLALWRYAHCKSKVAELYRDVPRVREPKRIPEAWSMEEFGRILSACSRVTGEMCGVPASLWWCGIVWVFYESGLRLCAALCERRSESATFTPRGDVRTRRLPLHLFEVLFADRTVDRSKRNILVFAHRFILVQQLSAITWNVSPWV